MAKNDQILLSESDVHLIYLKQFDGTEESRIYKRINSPFPSDDLTAQLKNEYLVSKDLDIPGIRKSINFSEEEGKYTLELDFIEGSSFKDLSINNSLSTLDIIQISVKLCDVLAKLHHAGWIHGSINSSSIIVNPINMEPTIIDATLMTRFNVKASSQINSEKLKSILPYISPEQTGRMNRALDHRTDFYSLGATLYEILLGKPAFESGDSLEVIHSHLAKIPVPLHNSNQEIPKILSDIIAKLLSKNAEDRYQSAYGLKFDFERLVKNWDKKTLFEFILCEKDFSEKLTAPQKIYGREKELVLLLKELEITLKGGCQVVLLSGESGTGKSILTQELRKPITENRGFFIQGKFDQFARNIPYSAWIEVFKDFINQILTEDEEEIKEWEAKLSTTLGDGAGVLVDLIPNLRHIIHDIPQVETLDITESKNRLNDLLHLFFKTIATKDHPLTIFIDDLQWADTASMNLFEALISDGEIQYVLFIGASRYRDAMGSDLLKIIVEELQQGGSNITKIELANLDRSTINELISDTINADPGKTMDLSEAIFNKTQGNPFFTAQFINSIYEEQLLKFNLDKSKKLKKSVWEWDIDQIRSKLISKNVVELLLKKISLLPSQLLETLKAAACIGNTFNLGSLCAIRKADFAEISLILDKAINEGYILHQNAQRVQWVHEGMDIEYQFVHDGVQQAVYSLIPDNERLPMHFKIGKLLVDSLEEQQITNQIFELIFHLNFGQGLITDEDEKKWLASLNFNAGVEAKKIIAFDSAYEFLTIAKSLVGEDIWYKDNDFAVELSKELLDCTYLTNRFEEAEEFFGYLISRLPDNVSKAELYYRKMVQYQHLSKIDKILETGLQGLALLGLKFSAKANRLGVIIELIKTYFLMRGRSEESLTNLPKMTDRASRIAMSLIYKSLTFAYDRSEELMAMLGMKLVHLTLKKGNHDFSIGGYSTYGGILSVGFGNYESGLKYNRVAIEASKRTGNKAAMAMAHFGMGMTTYPLVTFDDGLTEFQKSLDLALLAGAHTDAAPSTMYFFFLNFIRGTRLNELSKIVKDNLQFTKQIKTENFHLVLLAGLEVIQELKDGKGIILAPPDEISQQELEERLIKTEHNSIRIYSRIFQMHNHILFDRIEQAHKCEEAILNSINVTRGTVLGEYFEYLRALLYSRSYYNATENEKKIIRKIIKKSTKRIGMISKTCPSNFNHWHLLLNAELSKVYGRNQQAQNFYDQAIEASQLGGYLNEIAIGNLLCAEFNKSIGNSRISDYYKSEALQSFNNWGAFEVAKSIVPTFQGSKTGSPQVGTPIDDYLDQESLNKLSQTIAEEIDFNRLIKKLMKLFIENAGAEKVVLVMKSEGEWIVEAEKRKNSEVNIIKDKKLDEVGGNSVSPMLSTSVCKYVIRTKETVLIDESTNDERFSKSSYIKQFNTKSILCIPLIKRGDLVGLVYLENNITAGAFKSDRIRLLNYISTQIAISIENANLYSGIKELNKTYERFVPKEFLEILGKKSITDVNLGDQVQRDMTVLFADIRNFTSISEKMNPKENFRFINEYLSRMGPIIRKYHGFVDKYIGDEIMALFPTDADDALRCGIAMQHELKVYGDQLNKKGLERINIGIGLNTGKLMLGTVGGDDRMNSTVISDAVNIASRIEASTKVSGAPFMITKETYEQLKDPSIYAIRKMGKVIYPGKSIPSFTYEVFDGDDPKVLKLKRESLDDFERGLALFDAKEYQEALSIFNAIQKMNPEDKPLSVYVKRTLSHLNKILEDPKN